MPKIRVNGITLFDEVEGAGELRWNFFSLAEKTINAKAQRSVEFLCAFGALRLCVEAD